MRSIAILCAALSLGACATVTRGTSDSWTVNTTPSGAAVKTSNQFACDATPCTFKMPRKSEFEVTITKAGYKPWTGHITHQVSGAGSAGMAGNVILGGLIGAGVDVTTGAMLNLVPNPLTVNLEKTEVLEADSPAGAARVAVATAPASYAPPPSQPQPQPAATTKAPGKAAKGCVRVVTDPSQSNC